MRVLFADLDASLAALLSDPAAPAELRAADIAFDTPGRDYKPAEATLNLYLHDIAENRALRDEARVVERSGTGWSSRLPSLRLDCSYLVTAWSADTGGVRVAQEHRLLGLSLLWFSRFPVIPPGFLAGALAAPPQPFPVSAMVAQTREGQAMGQFWTALGTIPRPAFSVTVTITVDPFDHVEQAPAVKTVRVVTGSLTVLGGRLLDQALAPVDGAVVTESTSGASATTGPTGDFVLPGLTFGDHTLRVQLPGEPDRELSVSHALDHRFPDVVLPAQ